MAIRPLGSVSEYVTDILVNGFQEDSFEQSDNADYNVSISTFVASGNTYSGTYSKNDVSGTFTAFKWNDPVSATVDADLTANMNNCTSTLTADIKINGNDYGTSVNQSFSNLSTVQVSISNSCNSKSNDFDLDYTITQDIDTDYTVDSVTKS